MIGHIEWSSLESTDRKHASIVKCVGEQGLYHLEYANAELGSEGRIAFNWGQKGEQYVKAMYMFTDGRYEGEADVVGQVTVHDGIVTFNGTWHDPEDQTGKWDVYFEFSESDHIYTVSYDEPIICR
jgi:hypothetical protein